MTYQYEYDDLLDGEDGESVRPIVDHMATRHRLRVSHSLPTETDQAIRAMISSSGHISAVTRGFRRSWHPWLLRSGWSATAAAVLVACVVLAYTLLPRTASPVSADTILRRAAGFATEPGHYATLLYRAQYTYNPPIRGSAPLCTNGSRRNATFFSHLWLRGAMRGVPQTVVETITPSCRASRPTVKPRSCPLVFVGAHGYVLCDPAVPSSRESPYGARAVLQISTFYDIGVNLLYGDGFVRRLRRSLDDLKQDSSQTSRNSSAPRITAHRGTLAGIPVYVITVVNPPGGAPGDIVSLYYDVKTYVLRGTDFRSGGIEEKDRLIRAKFSAPPATWDKALALLPPYSPQSRTKTDPFGSDLVNMEVPLGRSSVRAACPGVSHLASLLYWGVTPVRACKRKYPHVTPSLLAWRMMRPRIRTLQAAQRAGIFPPAEVRASIGFEHAQMTAAAKYCQLGPVFGEKQPGHPRAQIVRDPRCPFPD